MLLLALAWWALEPASLAARSADGPPTTWLGLLVGSGAPDATAGLDRLEYPDDDVLRLAMALRLWIPATDMRLLMTPDARVAGMARGLQLPWQPPTRAGVVGALNEIEGLTASVRRDHPGREVRVVVYISSHGDSRGVHLDDGVLGAAALRQQLARLSADQVLVVADSCFSASWLGLKGPAAAASIDFPLDAVAGAVLELEKVGAITARSYTREERSLIRGGLLTHVVSSGLLGPADIDQDGLIRYDELEAWLTSYTRALPSLGHIDVHPPRRSSGASSVLIDLRQLPSRGLSFVASPTARTECFWVRASDGPLLGELCKPGRELRRVYLPAGRYVVTRWSPPERGHGQEQQVEVASGFAPVGWDPGVTDWVSSLFKGPENAPGQLLSARRLSDDEAGYLAETPFSRPVDWRALPGRLGGAVQAGWSVPLRPLGSGEGLGASVVSISQERPVGWVCGALDWRAARLGRGFGTVGGDVGVGASLHNVVGSSPDVTVWQATYRLRLGYERPLASSWSGRLNLALGGLTASPYSQGRLALTSSGAPQPGDPRGYLLPFAGVGALELSVALPSRRGWRLEVGGGPQVVVEPQLRGSALVPAPFVGLSLFSGIRF